MRCCLRQHLTACLVGISSRVLGAFHALSVFVFGLGCHYLTATCRGRIYPSRD
ncbi:MAG: hypothetical protein FWG87_05980 [Defluviitaleaceae bacterium]|nr:hypothetical protein [Defluviitaleaceae bacterium]